MPTTLPEIGSYIDSNGCPTRDFLLAGRAIFTIGLPTGTHYTYRVNRSEATERWPVGYWLSLLTGPENESDYTSIGKISPISGALTLNRRTTYTDDTFPVRLARRVLARIWAEDTTPIITAGYTLQHSGKCCACGRTLTTPDSIAAGIGPVCAEGGRDA